MLSGVLSMLLIGDLAGALEAWVAAAPACASAFVGFAVAWLFGHKAQEGTTPWAPEDELDGHDALQAAFADEG